MKTNLEIEYKTLITKSEFERVRAHFDFKEPIKQTNVYFDTPGHDLFSKKMMCRIRIIGNRFEFTLKIPSKEGVMEYETLLESLSLNTQELTDYFATLNIKALDLVETTRSETYRSIFSDDFGDWCLDETQFPHHKDYEIEYELHQPNKKAYPHYVDTLKSLNIEYKEAEPKYLRALHSSL